MTPSDDKLDDLLREGLRRPDLPCGPFDRRVMAALPRPHPSRTLYPILLCLGGVTAAAGVGFGVDLFGSQMHALAAERAGAWASGLAQGPGSGALIAVAVASCLSAWWTARAAFGSVRPPARR